MMKHGDFFNVKHTVRDGYWVLMAGDRVQFITFLDRDDAGRDCIVRSAPIRDSDKHVYVFVESGELAAIEDEDFAQGKYYQLSAGVHKNTYRYECAQVRGDKAIFWVWSNGERVTSTILPTHDRGNFREVDFNAVVGSP